PGSVPSQLQRIKSGKLVALAGTSSKPDPALPGIPTVAEAGVPGYEAVEWQGIVVPAGTPGPVIQRLNRAIVESVKAPDFTERLAGVGAHAGGSAPAGLSAFLLSSANSAGVLTTACAPLPARRSVHTRAFPVSTIARSTRSMP